MHATERKEVYVVRKLQRALTAMEARYERWGIKINEDKAQANYFSHWRGPVGTHLTLKGRNILSVKAAKRIGVIFDSWVTWRYHVDSIVTKALRTFIRMYPLLKSERLSAKSKLTLYKALIRSKMTYAYPAWEFAADSHLLKLQHVQNRVLRTTGYLSRCTLTRALHRAFQIPYVYDYIIRISRKQAEIIQNHDNVNVRNIGKTKPNIGRIKGSNLLAIRHTIIQVSKLSQLYTVGVICCTMPGLTDLAFTYKLLNTNKNIKTGQTYRREWIYTWQQKKTVTPMHGRPVEDNTAIFFKS